MNKKVQRTITIDQEVDEDISSLAYNLGINKLEVIKKLIVEGLDRGILEDFESKKGES
jgi:ABC-type phosphate transport system permease subunit